MQRRIRVLGLAFTVYGGALLVSAGGVVAVCLAFAGALMARGAHDEQMMMAAMFYVGAAGLAGLLGTLIGVPCLVVGTGLRLRRRWALAGGLLCGAMTVSHFPLGTALGLFAIATLLDRRVQEALDSR